MQSILLLGVGALFLASPLWPALRELRKPEDDRALDVNNGNPSDAFEALKNTLALRAQGAPSPAELLELKGLPAGAKVLELPPQAQMLAFGEPGRLNVALPEQVKAVHAPSLALAAGLQSTAALHAERVLVLEAGCEVRSACAPEIWAQTRGVSVPDLVFSPQKEAFDDVPGAHWSETRQCWYAKDAVVLPTGAQIKGDIVAERSVVVGPGALVQGSIKSASSVRVHSRGVVCGNVIAHDVVLQEGAAVKGCCVCDDTLVMQTNSQVGARSQGATALATDVLMGPGARVLGAVQAHRSVRVTDSLGGLTLWVN